MDKRSPDQQRLIDIVNAFSAPRGGQAPGLPGEVAVDFSQEDEVAITFDALGVRAFIAMLTATAMEQPETTRMRVVFRVTPEGVVELEVLVPTTY